MFSSKAIIFIANPNSSHSIKWISSIAKIGDHRCIWISAFRGISNRELERLEVNFIVAFKNPLKVLRFLREFANGSNFVIHHHYIGWNSLGVAFLLLIKRVPLISTPWGSDLNITNYFKDLLLRVYFRIPVLCTSDAEYMLQKLIKYNPLLSTERINFGVDTDLFRPIPRPIPIHRSNTKNNIRIISLRSLEPLYSIETLLYAFELFIRHGGQGDLTIVGEGSEKHKLLRLAATLNIKPNFVGRLRQSEIIEYLQSSDVYVSTSLSDAGLASSTAEAMACALPILTTNNSENNLWVIDNVNGFLFSNKDYVSLATLLHQLSSDKNLCIRLGSSGREMIQQKNSIKGQMLSMNTLYGKL